MAERIISSPIGVLLLAEEQGALCAVRRMEGGAVQSENAQESALLDLAQRELEEYFSGCRRAFSVPLRMRGTAFECRVWKALTQIPYGETRSYAQIAAQIGSPGAVRAVGRACGKNPLLIIAACHRVIGADRRLTGFSAGMDAKEALLALEGIRTKDGKVDR